MAYIYLIRHAQSQSNSKNDYSVIDTPLTPLGEKQAKATAEFVVQRIGRGIMPFFISSPSLRTLQTAMAFTEFVRLPIHVSLDAHEYNSTGNIELPSLTRTMMLNRFKDKIRVPGDMPEQWDAHPNESREQFERRALHLLAWLRSRPSNEVIVLVTHSYVIQSMVANAVDVAKDPSPIWNASVTMMECSNGKFRLIVYNDVDHLPEELQQWYIMNNPVLSE